MESAAFGPGRWCGCVAGRRRTLRAKKLNFSETGIASVTTESRLVVHFCVAQFIYFYFGFPADMWTPQYDIIVETLTGSEFEVTVTDKDTIGYIKSRIQKYEGMLSTVGSCTSGAIRMMLRRALLTFGFWFCFGIYDSDKISLGSCK